MSLMSTTLPGDAVFEKSQELSAWFRSFVLCIVLHSFTDWTC